MECVHQETGRSNSVSMYKSWNVPNRKQNQRVEDSTGVELMSAAFTDGAIYCKVIVDPVFKVADSTFDLDKDEYFVLLAAGASLKGTHAVTRRPVLWDNRTRMFVYRHSDFSLRLVYRN